MTGTKGGPKASDGKGSQKPAAGAWDTSERGDMEIPFEEWPFFLDSFSRQHKGWLTSVYVRSPDGGSVQITNCRLESVTGGQDEVYLTVVCGETRRGCTAPNPSRIIFKRDENGRHTGLDVTSADGSVTSLRFRVASRPETLDGVLSPAKAHSNKVEKRK